MQSYIVRIFGSDQLYAANADDVVELRMKFAQEYPEKEINNVFEINNISGIDEIIDLVEVY